jgi:guanylate kinase
VVSGPSGVGKTTICNALLELPGFHRIVTCTSRPARTGERDGVDYHFFSEDSFREGIERGDFLEHARVHGHYYGTPKRQVEDGLRRGRKLLLNIDVQGARQIREAVEEGSPLPLFVFVEPPSLGELERRLRERGTDGPQEVERRLATAVRELEERGRYELVVVNEKVPQAVDAIVRAVAKRSS